MQSYKLWLGYSGMVSQWNARVKPAHGKAVWKPWFAWLAWSQSVDRDTSCCHCYHVSLKYCPHAFSLSYKFFHIICFMSHQTSADQQILYAENQHSPPLPQADPQLASFLGFFFAYPPLLRGTEKWPRKQKSQVHIDNGPSPRRDCIDSILQCLFVAPKQSLTSATQHTSHLDLNLLLFPPSIEFYYSHCFRPLLRSGHRFSQIPGFGSI